MELLDFVNTLLALGIIVCQGFILLAIVYVLLPYKRNSISNFFSKNGIKFAFVVTLMSVAGSLFYSEYAGFAPCNLCWFQRIFMYPQVILLGLALLKKEDKIIDYSLALSIIGLVISAYHNYIFLKSIDSTFCGISGSCIIKYVLEYGYVTIPVMSFTAFLLVSLFLLFKKYNIIKK